MGEVLLMLIQKLFIWDISKVIDIEVGVGICSFLYHRQLLYVCMLKTTKISNAELFTAIISSSRTHQGMDAKLNISRH